MVKPGPISSSILPLALLWLQEMQAMSSYMAVGEHLQRVWSSHQPHRLLPINLQDFPSPACSGHICGVKLPLSSLGVFPAELGLERSSNVLQSLFCCC